MNLLFAINRKFTGLLCSCVGSIVQNGGADRYDAYVLHSDLQDRDMAHIRESAGEAVNFHFIQIEARMFEGFPESKRYPREIYYRLAAPLLLPGEMDRILYLDVDLVVINSLEELYHMDFEGNYYVACSHVRKFLTKCNRIRLGIENDVPYINTGVMVMNLSLLRKNLTMDTICAVAQKKMHTFLLPDQDLLTVMFGDRIKLVDTMRFNLSDRILALHNADPQNRPLDLNWIRENGVVVHYCGKNKPWNGKYMGTLDVFYNEITKMVSEKQLH